MTTYFGVAVCNKDGKYLFITRTGKHPYFGFPVGDCREGEDLEMQMHSQMLGTTGLVLVSTYTVFHTKLCNDAQALIYCDSFYEYSFNEYASPIPGLELEWLTLGEAYDRGMSLKDFSESCIFALREKHGK